MSCHDARSCGPVTPPRYRVWLWSVCVRRTVPTHLFRTLSFKVPGDFESVWIKGNAESTGERAQLMVLVVVQAHKHDVDPPAASVTFASGSATVCLALSLASILSHPCLPVSKFDGNN